MTSPRVAVLQLETQMELDQNLEAAAFQIQAAAQAGAKLVVLPEMFPIAGYFDNKLKIKESLGKGPIQNFLAEQAKAHSLWIVGGTIPISTADEQRVRASCLVYNEQGLVVGSYDKIHLFDVAVAEREYHESALIEAGHKTVVIPTPFGRLGLAVCYDLRFPELFRQLYNQGAELIALPAAFTPETGQAHWEILCRSRAIECQAYLLASAQTGGCTERKTYGHSLMIGPWGEVLAEMGEEVGFATAEVDLEHLARIRKNMPVKAHQRLFSTRESDSPSS